MGESDVDIHLADGANAGSGPPGEFSGRRRFRQRDQLVRGGVKLGHPSHTEFRLRGLRKDGGRENDCGNCQRTLNITT